MKKIKIARIVTIPEAFVHFKALLYRLKNDPNVELTLVSSDGKYKEFLKENINVDIVPINITREISLWNDLVSLLRITCFFIKNQFDIVHSSTPKAGLVSALAGSLFPKMIRIHTFTGQRWATLTGFKRSLLKILDRLIIKLNTQCYADSPSQIEYLIAEGVAKPGALKCINLGSYGGIDTKRFDNEKYPDARANLLKEIGARETDIIFLYVGRITRDKGIEDLVTAFTMACLESDQFHLVLVGPHESQLDALSESTWEKIQSDKKIHHLGFKTNPEFYFSAADIFCLPSYREGFGTVVLEAAACNLLTIGTKIPGLVDSVVNNETGILVEKKNILELKEAMVKLALDKELRMKLSRNAQKRARTEFDSILMAKLQWEEYERLLKKRS